MKCNARRHMTASEFRTYDAMLAAASTQKAKERMESGEQDYRLFFGSIDGLADRNNTCRRTEAYNIASLLRKEWLAVYRPQVHWRGGLWSTVQYIVWTHDEYVDTGSGGVVNPKRVCPPIVRVGKPKNRNIARANMRRKVKCDLPVEWLDAIIDAAAKKKR